MQPEKEKTEFLMQEETNFYSPAKNHRQFHKSLLSLYLSSRENGALQKCNSMAVSPLLPRYVPGFGGPWFQLTGVFDFQPPQYPENECFCKLPFNALQTL